LADTKVYKDHSDLNSTQQITGD